MGSFLLPLIVVVLVTIIIYLFYTYIYRSYRLYKAGTVVFDHQKEIPSLLYLLWRFTKALLSKRQGQLYYSDTNSLTRGGNQDTFTVYNCRLESNELRRYCSAFGYGWDYPDSTFRDIPFCYPEFLFLRLLTMIVCAESFRLSPLGLVRVRQTMITFQPIDELKKGPFSLQASVREYRAVDLGIEVDIGLAVADRSNKPVWEELVTLLSRDMKKITSKRQHAPGSTDPNEVKSVEVVIPWNTGLKYAQATRDYNPLHLFPATAKLLGCKRTIAYPLWTVSKCLAEIEKHEGTDAVRAPASVRVEFHQPLFMPGKAVIKFWENAPEGSTSSHKLYHFRMGESEDSTPHLVGEICVGEQ
ncbi:uncharacterized protein LOC136754854 [Amia ocellicauda]|uniref:uncharacterized protein LOC136754854 n=1 Tax=Amia ocellicauda TaxID=2972642 RepID=UPI003463896E